MHNTYLSLRGYSGRGLPDHRRHGQGCSSHNDGWGIPAEETRGYEQTAQWPQRGAGQGWKGTGVCTCWESCKCRETKPLALAPENRTGNSSAEEEFCNIEWIVTTVMVWMCSPFRVLSVGSQGSSPNQSKVLGDLSLVSGDVPLTYANIGLQELSGRAQPASLKALEKVWWVQ